jgi:DNA-binding LytR/AlgR family response regulator
MKQLKCIIVDDEPLAQDVLRNYINNTPFLELISCFHNAWELQNYLAKHSIDLLFLDIEMPGLDGLTFMKTIKNAPAVIFVTAYRNYAVDAFAVNAVDYLLKPVSFERFLQAVNKIKTEEKHAIEQKTEAPRAIYLLIDRQMKRLLLEEITYFEAQGDYIKIYTLHEKPPLTKRTLRDLLEELPHASFIQIHRSFIINKQHITAYTSDKVQVNGEWLKLSRSFKGSLNL